MTDRPRLANTYWKEDPIPGGGGKGKMAERREADGLRTLKTRELEESEEVVNCKRKGNAYELHIKKLVQEWFPRRNIRRSGILQTMTAHGTGDILGWTGVHAEVKDCKSLSMFEWLRKMAEVCELTGEMPVLFFHQPASKGFKYRDSDLLVCRAQDFPFLAVDFVEQQRDAG